MQPKALQLMLSYDPEEPDFEHLTPMLECLQDTLGGSSNKIITAQLWEDAVKKTTEAAVDISEKVAPGPPKSTKQTNLRDLLSNQNKEEKEVLFEPEEPKVSPKETTLFSYSNKQVDWKILDAFVTPTLKYDSLRQQFYYEDKAAGRPPLFGSVQDKVEMMAQRFLRVQQRVARSVPNMTSIDRLLGTSVASIQVLLGLLHATSTSSALAEAEGIPATGFELEDLTGSIPLQILSNARLDTRGLYTDGCIVLVEGYYEDGIFNVNKIKLPPMESKALSKPFIPPLSGGFPSNHTATAAPLSIYTISNVSVNEPLIMNEFNELVDHLASEQSLNQVLLVIMGNFTDGSMPLSAALGEISRSLKPLPSNHSVVIMPGPKDTPSMCWPIPAIKAPSSFSQDLNVKVEFVSNPCRLQYGNKQDVLLYRQDMIQQHLQNEILSSRNSSRDTVKGRILYSVLSQGHLLPKAPIYWNYDYALGMYPLPDLMLVGFEEGEDCVGSFYEEECQIVAPGSQGNWAKVTLQPKRKRRITPQPLMVEFLRDSGGEAESGDETDSSLMNENY